MVRRWPALCRTVPLWPDSSADEVLLWPSPFTSLVVEKEHRCVTVPFRSQYAIEWETSVHAQTKNLRPVWPGPACHNAWEQPLLKPVKLHSSTYPSTLGSFWLDDQMLLFKLQIELGKQIICNFGVMTFLVIFFSFFYFPPTSKFSFEN